MSFPELFKNLNSSPIRSIGTVLLLMLLGIILYNAFGTQIDQSDSSVDKGDCACYGSTLLKRSGDEQFNLGSPPSFDAINVTLPAAAESKTMASKTANMVGMSKASPIDSMTYANSADTMDYYIQFSPPALTSAMPMGWRSSREAEDDKGVFGEFKRYTISQPQLKKAENLKSVVRITESSRDGLSRSLGQRSLLRESVSPLSTVPCGHNSKLFNDSSVRQHHIANLTGQYPELSECC